MKSRSVLLINPWIYDFAAYDLWVKPLGLLYIDAVLRRNGYRTRLIDCLDRSHPDLLRLQGRHRPRMKRYGAGPFYKEFIDKPQAYRQIRRRYGRYGVTEEIFLNELKAAGRPDAVLVTSGMTYWYPGPLHVIRLVKAHFPGVPVVLGGIYATLCPEHARGHSGADQVVEGEGEIRALECVDELTGRQTSFRPEPQDLDSYPWPCYDSYGRLDWLPLLTSRGCPYQCPYCASHLLWGTFRQRDPLKVWEEIEHAYRKMRVKTFVFYDDALLVRASEHLLPLLEAVIQGEVHCTFHTPNGLQPRAIDREVAEMMFRSGFRTVRLSFETADQGRQAENGPKVTNADLMDAIDHLKAAGYQGKELEVYVLAGLPGQSLEEMVESVMFVARLGAKARLAFYSPIPGTGEWEKAVRLFGFDPEADPLLHNNSIHPFHPAPSPGEEPVEAVQQLSKVLNAAIDQGVNTLNGSVISRTFVKILKKWDSEVAGTSTP